MRKTFDASLFDELQNIYPDTDTADGSKLYRVSAANGGYAGVHIMLNGLTPGIPVTFEIIGEHRSYRMFELVELPVEVNTGADQRTEFLKDDINEFVVRRAPFMTYDVYRPMFNIIKPTGVSAAAAFLCEVEYRRGKKKSRRWTIIVTHGEEQKKLEFIVDEYPVRIPSTAEQKHRYVNWVSYNSMATAHGVAIGSREHIEMIRRYFKVLVYSRQNMAPIHPSFSLVDGKAVLDVKLLDTLVDLAIEAGFSWFNGTAFCGRAYSQADDKAFWDSLPHDTIENPREIEEIYKKKAFDAFDYGADAMCLGELIPGKGEEYLKDLSEQMYAYVTKKGLNDRWLQCCLDEPNDALEGTYRKMVDIMHKAMPGIKILEPMLPTEKLDDTADVWCPSLDIYEQNQAYYDKQVDKGVEMFVYSCLTPGGNYCNRLLDMDHLRQVYIGWAPILYPNISGFLHWGANQGGVDLFDRSARQFSGSVMDFHEKFAMMLPAGDPAIIYPWRDIPCVTARSEAHRIGYEDLELLQKLPYEQALALCQEVFNGYADYTKDIKVYRKVKEELMKAVMAIEKE